MFICKVLSFFIELSKITYYYFKIISSKFLNLNFINFLKRIREGFYNLPFIKKPLPRYPFGKSIWAEKQKYMELHRETLKLDDRLICAFEEKSGFKISKKWWADLALHTQVVIKKGKLNFLHGRILYSSLSSYLNNLDKKYLKNNVLNIFETGTARGFSSICMAKAIIDSGCQGTIITIDPISHNERFYWNCIDDHNGPQSRENLLSKWDEELSKIIFIQGWTNEILPKLGIRRIHFAFLDAQHTKEDILKEFEFVSKKQIRGDVIVFDDVTKMKFPGVCEAIEIIKKQNIYKIQNLNFDDLRGYAIATKL